MSWPNDETAFHQRVLDATRRVRLGDAVRVGDTVKVVGTATVDEGWLRAPLSGSDRCLCWAGRVDEAFVLTGAVVEEARSTRFWVFDGGIRARVHPPLGFGMTARETERGSDAPEPERLLLAEAFLRQHGELPWRRVGERKVRRELTYRERRVDEGDVVAVVGRVREVQRQAAPAVGGGYREQPAAETSRSRWSSTWGSRVR
jgi:hypothetical protein